MSESSEKPSGRQSYSEKLPQESRSKLATRLRSLAYEFYDHKPVDPESIQATVLQVEPIDNAHLGECDEGILLYALADAVERNEVHKELERAISHCRKYEESLTGKGCASWWEPQVKPPEAYRNARTAICNLLALDPDKKQAMAPDLLVQSASGYVVKVLQTIDRSKGFGPDELQRWYTELCKKLRTSKDEKSGREDWVLHGHSWDATHVLNTGLLAAGVDKADIEKIDETNDRMRRKQDPSPK